MLIDTTKEFDVSLAAIVTALDLHCAQFFIQSSLIANRGIDLHECI